MQYESESLLKAKYRVFFSRDCMMYGVEKLIEDNGRGMFWQQVLPPNGCGARRGASAYTHYEGVAKRWLKTIIEQETKSANTAWAKQFSGTASEFIEQAKQRGMSERSIRHWVKFNWNIGAK